MNFVLNPKATHLLLRHQEITLKGRNRPEFERRLKKNVELYLHKTGTGEFRSSSGRFLVELKTHLNGPEILEVMDKLSMISGIAAITPCMILPPDAEKIQEQAIDWAKQELSAKRESLNLRHPQPALSTRSSL